jgi:DNA-binding IclR family transcriptional regulator
MIQSVDRSVRILRALSDGSKRLGVSELAESLGLAKGTVHGLLRTLRDQGMVEQNAETGKYQLGPTLLALSSGYLDVNELRTRSLAWSELLASRAGESVRVGVPHSGAILVVHHVFRPDASLQILEVGAVLPLHATALGKAVFAYLPEDARAERIAAGLPQFTRNTLTTASDLEKDFELITGRRYAVESEEAIIGESAIASPIFDGRGAVIGAIGIAGSRERVSGPDREELLSTHVVEASRAISREMGGGAYPRPA